MAVALLRWPRQKNSLYSPPPSMGSFGKGGPAHVPPKSLAWTDVASRFLPVSATGVMRQSSVPASSSPSKLTSGSLSYRGPGVVRHSSSQSPRSQSLLGGTAGQFSFPNSSMSASLTGGQVTPRSPRVDLVLPDTSHIVKTPTISRDLDYEPRKLKANKKNVSHTNLNYEVHLSKKDKFSL